MVTGLNRTRFGADGSLLSGLFFERDSITAQLFDENPVALDLAAASVKGLLPLKCGSG
jgi:hypothetical protein